MSRARSLLLLAALMAAPAASAAPAAPASAAPASAAPAAPGLGDQSVTLFDRLEIQWVKDLPDGTAAGPCFLFDGGQVVQATVTLPDAPANQRDARRIMATIEVEPVLVESEGKSRPGDPWTRLGNLSVMVPGEKTHQPAEVEVVRFITGFGGAAKFEQDVTALAPLLAGRATFRISISTWLKPGWRVTARLAWSAQGAGYRRPVFARPLFNDADVTARTIADDGLKASVSIPRNLEQPRLRIISTGHATDGTGGDEFITRTHTLLVDGAVVARWRPWTESGGQVRPANPMSGRQTIDGRELWSSDLDRSGWTPGRVVEPLVIPLPQLTPGVHTFQVQIEGIRPKDESGQGYWRVSAIIVADEPWPVAKEGTK